MSYHTMMDRTVGCALLGLAPVPQRRTRDGAHHEQPLARTERPPHYRPGVAAWISTINSPTRQ